MFDFMDTWSWSCDDIRLICHTPHLCAIFSCEDAAQQVLMSVCLSVSVCVDKLKFYLLTPFNVIAECSRMFQNVPECSRMHAEYSRMFQNACRMSQNAGKMFQNVPECSWMHAECSRMHKKIFHISMFLSISAM